MGAGVVAILPDNLAKIVDTKYLGGGGGRGIVDGSVDTVSNPIREPWSSVEADAG